MKNDFQPVAGHRFTFSSILMPQWNGIIDGEVMAVEPHKRLSYNLGIHGLEDRRGLFTPDAPGRRARRAWNKAASPPTRTRTTWAPRTDGRSSWAAWKRSCRGWRHKGDVRQRRNASST